ncbi:hypothetical protein LCM16_25000 [Mameliella alba]|nr:hypothetical protein [Mameliella alba]
MSTCREGASEEVSSVERRNRFAHSSDDAPIRTGRTNLGEGSHYVGCSSNLAPNQESFKGDGGLGVKRGWRGLESYQGHAVLFEDAVSIGPGKNGHHCENGGKGKAHSMKLSMTENREKECRAALSLSIWRGTS